MKEKMVKILLPRGRKNEENFVIVSVNGRSWKIMRGADGALPEVAKETELTAETPYDEMYRYYVEAQIHYANGETARYNNAVSLWNNGFLTYRDYCCRRETPEGRAKALRLC